MCAFSLVKLLNDPVSLTFQAVLNARGAYDNDTTYEAGDSVSYTDGSSYVAIQTTKGNLPTDTVYWQLIAEKGETGTTVEGAFTDLTDTPSSYNNKAGNHIKVNSTEDGIDFETVQRNANSTGLISGGELSINGLDDTKFDISAGKGIFVDNHTNPAEPTVTDFSWETQTGLTDPYIAICNTTFVGFYSNGTMSFKAEDFTPEERRDFISIGWLDHPNRTNITFAYTEPTYNGEVYSQFADFTQAFDSFNIEGNDYLPVSGLTIKKTAGKCFDNDANFQINFKSPHIIESDEEIGCEIKYSYRDGAGDWVNDTEIVTEIDPDHYDDGSGTLADVPAGDFTIQVISFYPIPGYSGNDIQFGQVVYETMKEAKSSLKKKIELNPFNYGYDLYRTFLIVKQGATDLTDTDQAAFYNAGKFGLFFDGDSLIETSTIFSSDEYLMSVLNKFCGLITGGLLSIHSGGTLIDVTDGSSSYADYSDPEHPTIEVLRWDAQTIDPGLSSSVPRVWIGIQRDSIGVGKFVFSPAFTGLDKRTTTVVGRAWGNGTSTITGIGQYTTTAYYQQNTLIDLIRALGSLNRDGNVFFPNGANLLLDKSSGNSFRFTANYLAEPTSPNSIANPTMTGITTYNYHIFNDTVIHAVSAIDPEYYDNAGTKTTVPTGKFTVQRIYYFPVSNVVDLTYGQEVYDTMADALAGATIEQVQIDTLNASTLEGSILRCFLIVKQGCTDLSQVTQAKFLAATNLGAGGASSGVVGITSHNDLENIQGGATNEYYHLTSAKNTVVQNTSGTNSGDETTTSIGSLINGATEKTTPVDADMLGLMDSEATNILKKFSWANIKSKLKTYFDTVYTLANLGGVPTSRTVNGKALSGNITLGLSSSDFANQGTTGLFLQGNASGNPTWSPPIPKNAYSLSAGESSVTGTTAFQEKLSVSITPVSTGDFAIHFSCLMANSAANKLMGARIQIDNTTTIFNVTFMMGNNYASGDWKCVSGVTYANLTNVSHNIDLDFQTLDSARVAYIKNANILITKLS